MTKETERRAALRYVLAQLPRQDFRSRFHPDVRTGKAPVLAAHVDDLAHDVFRRVGAAGGAANVVAHTDRGFAILWVERGLADATPCTEHQDVGHGATLGMMIETLCSIGIGNNVAVRPIVRCAADSENVVATGQLISA